MKLKKTKTNISRRRQLPRVRGVGPEKEKRVFGWKGW